MQGRAKTTVSVLLIATFMVAGCTGESKTTAAAFTATATNADKTNYRFDAGPSSGEGLTFDWDFGDRSAHGTKRVEEHRYEYPNGKYRVTLTVTGKAASTAKVSQEVQVGTGENSGPVLFLSADKRLAKLNDTVAFDSTLSYDDDGDPLFWEWDFNSLLTEPEFAAMQDLGKQQYGFYDYGPPKSPPASNDSGSPTGDSGEEPNALTPSGHDWQEEYEKAKKRLTMSSTRDGGHGAATPEPRNMDFDGRIEDTSPIQLFQFPAPATYFVNVKLYDIKGDMAEGFLKIKAAESVPSDVEVHQARDIVLVSSSLDPLQQAGAADSHRGHEFNYNASGFTDINITFVRNPDVSSLTAEVSLLVCPRATAYESCTSPVVKREHIAATGNITHNIDSGATFPLAYNVWVVNTGQARIQYTLNYTTRLDLNPWAGHESGKAPGH